MFTRLRWRIAVAYVALIVVALLAVGLDLVASAHNRQLRTLANHLDRPAAIAAADDGSNQDTLIVLGATALAGTLAIVLAFPIARGTTEPIGRLTKMVKLVAAGDLTQRVVVDARDELGELATAFNDMARELRTSISAIEEQRAELTAILAGMADGVMIVDDQERVVALNRAAERMLEVSHAKAVGRTVAEVARRHELVARLGRGRADDRPLVIEVGPDHRQVQVVVTPIQVSNLARQVVLFQDVTALRRAEAMRRDFVANVSHELRTPLASLQALVETLEGGALEDPPAAREFLDRMHVEVDGLRQMVEELLELSRIESGRMKLRLELTDVGSVVGEAARRLAPQAERQGVALRIDAPVDEVDAPIDASRVQQIVVNLVHNAIKFTPPQGKVHVSVERRGRHVAIVVADTGIGVPPDELPRLFERFYKVDRSRSSSGTGLGLAIVKHLVQAHSGRVWAESPGEGEGTSFFVLLPLAEQTAESAVPIG
jgi:two-component system phosphate regulon sensor histidine kinase PhoR